VDLQPGESKVVTFTLVEQDFAFFDPDANRWVAEAGQYRILVGASAAEIRLKGDIEFAAG